LATDVIMPQMGFDMEEGTVIRWLKAEGDNVDRGEPIVEVETDKATVEVEAFDSGLLRRIVISEGVTVPVGQVIGIIAAADEDIPSIESPAPGPSVKAGPVVATPTPPTPSPPAKADRLLVSPLAKRIAEEKGVDLSNVTGTGPKGRITKEDVLAAAEVPPSSTPAPTGDTEVTELSRMGQTIARRMTQSKQEVPHFYVTASIDMTRAMALREELNELWAGEARLTVNDLIIKASALALARFPTFNAHYADGKIVRNPSLNIGVAIALEDGLIAPAILDCGGKTLKEISAASRDLSARARDGVLRPQEYTEATIAISNLGMFQVDSFIAIINPGQSASIAVGSVTKQPVVREGQITIADVMQCTISADHRVVNGADAAQFVNEIKSFLEKPSSLLL
jgi:pyruvate dehydrogenase E2 component (dihydrolipoamide acetyltransferase)